MHVGGACNLQCVSYLPDKIIAKHTARQFMHTVAMQRRTAVAVEQRWAGLAAGRFRISEDEMTEISQLW